MEHFSEVSGKDLQRLLRTCGQVVHPDIFVLTARCYHVPGKTEREHPNASHVTGLPSRQTSEVLLVVLAPVTAKYGSRMFVLVEDFTVHRSDDAVGRKP